MSVRELALSVVRRLQKRGFRAYFVGGCVRDELLGKTPHDYDVATDATPEVIETTFARTIPVGRQFGVMLVLENGIQIEVATFRKESGYADGRHPQNVAFSTPEEDAQRRDFTVNGLFLDPVTGTLLDWVGGVQDLKAKVLRTIGDPTERFTEDKLRLLRAIRFAKQLEFTIAPETFSAVQHLAAGLRTVSAERIRDELSKLFSSPNAAIGFDLLIESGLIQHCLPELVPTLTCAQSPDFHPEGTVGQHLRLMLSLMPPPCDGRLPWAVLMHDIAKPMTASTDPVSGSIHFYGHEKIGAEMATDILTRLRFPSKTVEEISTTVLHHMQFKDVRTMRRSTLLRMLARPTFELELALHRLDCLGSHRRLDHYEFMQAKAEEFATEGRLPAPLLKGGDLIAMGVSPGPSMGKLLAEVRERQLMGEITTRDQALLAVRSQLSA